MILRLQVRIFFQVNNNQLDSELPSGSRDMRPRLLAQAMRPATGAVIIALLLLILASSLIWLLRSF